LCFSPGQPGQWSSYSWQARVMSHRVFLMRWGLANILPGLASNCCPPDLCFLNSRTHRHL
jgi:hypothetical protein